MEDFIKKIKQELKNNKLANIFCRSLYDGFIMSFQGTILCCNQNLADIFGYKEEELEGAEISILFPDIPKRERKKWFEKEDAIIKGRKKDGRDCIVRIRGKVVNYKGKKLQFFAIQDLTEAENYRQIIKESEERYRVLTESLLDGIFLTDLEGNIIYANPGALEMFGFKDIKEAQKKSFFDLALPQFIERVKTDFKLISSGKGEFLVEYQVRDVKGTSFWVEAIGSRTVFGKRESNLICLRDITERKLAEESLRKMQGRMKKVLEETVSALSRTIAEKDPYTSEHQRRVSKLACAIAEKMGFLSDFVDGLRIASILHDIGKIYIPGEILSAPRPLTDIEMALVRLHPVKGYHILKDIDFPWPVAKIVFQHHERFDGSGYPEGIDDDNILLESRILAVADVVEAMSSHRPYRDALGIESALKEIETKKGLCYDEKVVNTCKELFKMGFRL
ncbi:MAG: PAS domain S-box protein [Candidatus Omnitrophica bacterium]|nr:PAS domain S-box protein [Candidatus Omnitrophota bacterium]